jgi:integrase
MLELPCIDWLDFCAKLYRRKKKATTALLGCRAMYYFARAYKADKKRCPSNELKQIIESKDTNKALAMLDDFVGHCDTNRQLLAGATSVHVRAIKRVLRFAGLKIENTEFKDKISMPMPTSAIEEPPKDEQIRAILNCASMRLRGGIMTMSDSGLGRSEVIRLRPKDYHFDEDPVRIETHRFKTGEYIETFVTRETANTTKQIIAHFKLGPDDYIFVKHIKKHTADKFSETYITALQKAGLDQKLEIRIADEVKQHRYYKYHLHIYRKRWFTKAINVMPAYVAYAMLGRKQYLDQYLAHPLSERQAFYKKISKHVGLFESKQDEETKRKQAAEMLGLDDLSPQQMTKLKGILWRMLNTPDNATKLLGGEVA